MYHKFEKYFRNYSPFHVRLKTLVNFGSTKKNVLVAHIDQPKWIFYWKLHFGH